MSISAVDFSFSALMLHWEEKSYRGLKFYFDWLRSTL